MGFLDAAWKWFVANIFTQTAMFMALLVLIGLIIAKKKWYEALAGMLKAYSIGSILWNGYHERHHLTGAWKNGEPDSDGNVVWIFHFHRTCSTGKDYQNPHPECGR